jgi:hypothetical protein
MIVRKRRTREHVIADLGVNYVERQVLLCGHTVERVRADYGYDLLLSTYDNNGEPENGEVYIQVKSTDALPLLKDGATISWRLHRTDLARWLTTTAAVILIVYDAQADCAYWLYVQRHFQRLEAFNLFTIGQSYSVHIPGSQTFDSEAIKQVSNFRDAINRQSLGVIDRHA